MTCIKKRRGKYVLDYRDALGERKRPSFDTKHEAEDAQLLLVPRRRHRSGVLLDSGLTVWQYGQLWLRKQAQRTRSGDDAPTLSPATLAQYESVLEHHLKGTALAELRISQARKSDVRDVLLQKLDAELASETVRRIHATFRTMFTWAIDDEMIAENPATGKWVQALGLVRSPRRRQEEIKAFKREQRDRFLRSGLRESDPVLYDLCVGSFLTGVRLGEALAGRISAVLVDLKVLRVEYAISSYDREVRPPKSGHGRDVKLSKVALTFFGELASRRRAEGFEAGERDPLLFPSTAWTPLDHRNVSRRFAAAVKAAGLPAHLTPHGMRHTYASLELERGTPIQFVQEQLGHASIQETVDTYGRWIPKENPLGDDERDMLVTREGE